LLDGGNELALNIDKTPRVKTDYHTIGACYEVIKTLRSGVAAE
jgi:mannose/cellobiose epimerase-like protein (N-acyl-D-glucosamine 2-epimerase family)